MPPSQCNSQFDEHLKYKIFKKRNEEVTRQKFCKNSLRSKRTKLNAGFYRFVIGWQ
jgi:hypothetical protein